MIMFDDLYFFVSVVGAGSFSKAAKQLKMHQSTLSRRVDALEQLLKIKLIKNVSYGKLNLTDEGSMLYELIYQQFPAIESAIEKIKLNNKQVHGVLNLIS